MQNNPLSEYPRPQLVRDSYLSLNGVWEYAIREDDKIPSKFDGEIIVPFSPETNKNGNIKTLQPNQYLFYRKKIDFTGFEIKDKVILRFLAVDQIAEVFVNGKFVGKHVGGFLPFSYEIKRILKENDNEIVLRVKDTTNASFYSSGKQSLNPYGIFYPAQSGIYLPVFIESVSDTYIKHLVITPNVDDSTITIFVDTTDDEVNIYFQKHKYTFPSHAKNVIKVDNPILWTPENPHLYEFEIETKGDRVKSYFALRKVSLIRNENGDKIIALNNKPYFMKGILDQGYYKDTLLTPQNDQDYINDIQLIKDLGFNTVRKHIKIESPRWYYYCDKMGLIVWQDFVNACSKLKFFLHSVPLFLPIKRSDHNYKLFSRQDEEGRNQSVQEFKDTIQYLYNVPSICVWTIFNEGWGQFDSHKIYKQMKTLDSTRLFDHASGWHDQGSGDFCSLHVYLKKIKYPNKRKLNDRAFVVSECGAFLLDETEGKKNKKGIAYNVYTNKEDFIKRFTKFINEEIIPNKNLGMSAYIYTQLSDVETEKNGFITYDRKTIKVDKNIIKALNDSIN